MSELGCFGGQRLLDSSVIHGIVMGQSTLICTSINIQDNFVVTWKINSSIKIG